MDSKWIVNLKGREFPTFPGVLDEAHKAGLRALTTEIVQIPAPENGHLAVVRARAEFEDGRVFEDVGDCSPQSTSPQLAAAALRLASTRAKGRVLRDAVNVGQALLEEMPEMEGAPAEAAASRTAQTAWRGNGGDAPRREGSAPPFCAEEGCGVELPQAVQAYSLHHFGKPLCREHQPRRGAVA